MEQMIRGKYINQGEDLSNVLKIREAVFGKGADEKDTDAVHIFVSLVENAEDEGIPVGCGRLNLDMDRFRFTIDYVGVLEPYRRNGYGEFTLRALVDKVNQCGADRVFVREELLNTEEAEHFFKRMFFSPSEESGFWGAKIDSFHTCCH